jgi:ATP-dependent Clp protease protease subunit
MVRIADSTIDMPSRNDPPPKSRIHGAPRVDRVARDADRDPLDWELMINGELDEKHELAERLAEVPRKSRGTIYFDSCGGSAFIGLSLASLIRLRGLRATGVVAGECSSAAILPFAACERRFVTAHSTLLFHPLRWQSEESVRLEEAAEWARHFHILEKDMDALLVRFFGCAPDIIAKWTRPGRFVSGPELVEAGLAEMVSLFDGDLWTQVRR